MVDQEEEEYGEPGPRGPDGPAGYPGKGEQGPTGARGGCSNAPQHTATKCLCDTGIRLTSSLVFAPLPIPRLLC